MTGAILTMGEPLGVFSAQRRGRLTSGSTLTLGIAGSECNVAIALARLGIPTWFSGCAGEDTVGYLVRQVLSGEGVHLELFDQNPNPTGLMIKEWYGLRPEPQVYYYRKGTAMQSWSPPEAWPPEIGWVHLSGITLMIDEGLYTRVESWIARWARAHPGSLSLDLNVRNRLGSVDQWRNHLEKVMALASVIFASRSELVQLWDTDRNDDLVTQGVMRSDQALVVTDGTQGAWAMQGASLLGEAPAIAIDEVVDVVGAGDGFAAGVLAGRWRGWDWPKALRLGTLVGAFAVAHPGDWEGYPRWQEVQAFWDGHWIDR